MKVYIITPEGALAESESAHVRVPAWDGEMGILDHHAPMMAALGKGVIQLDSASYEVDGGVLQVENNELRILAEQAKLIS